jgi:Uma2 family endonuclease
MTAAVADPPKLLTAEQFAAMPELGRFTELVKGEVIHVPPPGFQHGYVCLNIGGTLREHVRARELGRVLSNDSGVVTERDPDTVRGADVAYFSYERLPKAVVPQVYPEVPPEVVFEVLSPDDRWVEISAKITEYLVAGVKLVFVVDPARRTAMLCREDVSPEVFGLDDEIPFPGVFPDLRFTLRSVLE